MLSFFKNMLLLERAIYRNFILQLDIPRMLSTLSQNVTTLEATFSPALKRIQAGVFKSPETSAFIKTEEICRKLLKTFEIFQ